MSASEPRGALTGVRVIDLTQVLAGPFCTQLLADHGAEVLKIEPLKGDETRRLGPYRADDELREISGYYQSVNRNKKSIALDLKSPEGRDILFKLVDGADALVENYRAGVMERFGMSYETLSARNLKLVYAAIRGFGDQRSGESPYVHWPAFDIVGQAMGGIMSITGPDAQTPVKVGPGVGDLIPGMLASFGIVMALMEARQSGVGQFVDVSMVDCVLATCERIINQYTYTGRIPRPEGNRHPLLCPYGVVRASDGWLTISAPTDEFWQKLVTLMDQPHHATDPRYAQNNDRLNHQDEVYGLIEAFTQTKTKAELTALFGGVIPFGPIYDVADIFEEPHFKIREMLVDVEQPGSATSVKVAGVPVKMSRTPGRVRHRAPLLGENTREVLELAGYSGAEADNLFNRNIVK